MVSIICIFCDKDVHLLDSFISKLKESNKKCEIILVDNRINKKVSVCFENVKVISDRHKTNVFCARRDGVFSSSGDYVWFVDPDDECFTLDESLLTSDYNIFNFTTNSEKNVRHWINVNESFDISTRYLKQKHFNFAYGLWCKVIKKQVLINVYSKEKDFEYNIYEDTFLSICAYGLSSSISFNVQKIYNYVFTKSQSFYSNRNRKREAERIDLAGYYRELKPLLL